MYSCASSMIKRSTPSPRPPFDVLVRYSMRPPVSMSSRSSLPDARREITMWSASYKGTLRNGSRRTGERCSELVLEGRMDL